MNLGLKGAQALTLNNETIATMAHQSCQEADQNHKIAAANSQYVKRLNKIKQGLPKSVNGQTLQYKVYLKAEPNAWAMPNGCIRLYSGLMDMMDDDEIRGVLGHEIGHIALGHATNRMRTAAMASLGRDLLSSSSNATLASLSRSDLGALGEGFINAQFSQKQELEADQYSVELHLRENRDPLPIASAFDKLAQLGNRSSLFSTHPAPKARAERIRQQLQQQ